MRLAHPQLESELIFGNDAVNTLVIEHPCFFRELISDLYRQINYGMGGKSVLSVKDRPVELHRYAELIDSFVSFDINRKTLVNKITTYLEQQALNESNYMRTMELCSMIETYIGELSMDFPCSIGLEKSSIGAYFKAAGIVIENDYTSDLEMLIDYMELVRTFDRDKLFIFVNMRSYYSNEEMELFLNTALAHDERLLLIDNAAMDMLSNERRVIIDRDLCEI